MGFTKYKVHVLRADLEIFTDNQHHTPLLFPNSTWFQKLAIDLCYAQS